MREDFLTLDDINQVLIEYHKIHGVSIPNKLVLSEAGWESLKSLAHTGNNGWDFGERAIRNKTLNFGSVKTEYDIPLELDKSPNAPIVRAE